MIDDSWLKNYKSRSKDQRRQKHITKFDVRWQDKWTEIVIRIRRDARALSLDIIDKDDGGDTEHNEKLKNQCHIYHQKKRAKATTQKKNAPMLRN